MQQFDPELIARAKSGEETALAALIARMMPAIRRGAARCTVPGLDFEDAVQEGLIGLFDAVRSYEPGRGAFASYAAACIAHAQQDAARAATRKKHAPLNDSVPLPEDSAAPGPEELAIVGETVDDVIRRIKTQLSPMERGALLCAIDGRSAAETARLLGREPKAVENALARARRKLRGAT
ncbi:sigma-70 family RNA polymerase sigma factor [uncultured Gemmiger sp.]|uniref:sigma-70 family RNA polymerase sigma factor n=1 Tax=uncultured Gemmiger sp. TaxID=1623490 RepID=UPI0025F79045|nr:sigma-70 family RNA polymerase sigma factor [uncultured Gemmiger sp.]